MADRPQKREYPSSEELGTTGSIKWNGDTPNGKPLPTDRTPLPARLPGESFTNGSVEYNLTKPNHHEYKRALPTSQGYVPSDDGRTALRNESSQSPATKITSTSLRGGGPAGGKLSSNSESAKEAAQKPGLGRASDLASDTASNRTSAQKTSESAPLNQNLKAAAHKSHQDESNQTANNSAAHNQEIKQNWHKPDSVPDVHAAPKLESTQRSNSAQESSSRVNGGSREKREHSARTGAGDVSKTASDLTPNIKLVGNGEGSLIKVAGKSDSSLEQRFDAAMKDVRGKGINSTLPDLKIEGADGEFRLRPGKLAGGALGGAKSEFAGIGGVKSEFGIGGAQHGNGIGTGGRVLDNATHWPNEGSRDNAARGQNEGSRDNAARGQNAGSRDNAAHGPNAGSRDTGVHGQNPGPRDTAAQGQNAGSCDNAAHGPNAGARDNAAHGPNAGARDNAAHGQNAGARDNAAHGQNAGARDNAVNGQNAGSRDNTVHGQNAGGRGVGDNSGSKSDVGLGGGSKVRTIDGGSTKGDAVRDWIDRTVGRGREPGFKDARGDLSVGSPSGRGGRLDTIFDHIGIRRMPQDQNQFAIVEGKRISANADKVLNEIIDRVSGRKTSDSSNATARSFGIDATIRGGDKGNATASLTGYLDWFRSIGKGQEQIKFADAGVRSAVIRKQLDPALAAQMSDPRLRQQAIAIIRDIVNRSTSYDAQSKEAKAVDALRSSLGHAGLDRIVQMLTSERAPRFDRLNLSIDMQRVLRTNLDTLLRFVQQQSERASKQRSEQHAFHAHLFERLFARLKDKDMHGLLDQLVRFQSSRKDLRQLNSEIKKFNNYGCFEAEQSLNLRRTLAQGLRNVFSSLAGQRAVEAQAQMASRPVNSARGAQSPSAMTNKTRDNEPSRSRQLHGTEPPRSSVQYFTSRVNETASGAAGSRGQATSNKMQTNDCRTNASACSTKRGLADKNASSAKGTPLSPRSLIADSKLADRKVEHSKFTDSKFADSKFADSKFTDSKFADSKFTDSKFADSKFTDSKFADSKFTDSNLPGNKLGANRQEKSPCTIFRTDTYELVWEQTEFSAPVGQAYLESSQAGPYVQVCARANAADRQPAVTQQTNRTGPVLQSAHSAQNRRFYVCRDGDTLSLIATNELKFAAAAILLFQINASRLSPRTTRDTVLSTGLQLLLPTDVELAAFRDKAGKDQNATKTNAVFASAEVESTARYAESWVVGDRKEVRVQTQTRTNPQSAQHVTIKSLAEGKVRLVEERQGTSFRLEVFDADRWQCIVQYEVNTVQTRRTAPWSGQMRLLNIDLPLYVSRQLARNDLECNWQSYCSEYLSAS